MAYDPDVPPSLITQGIGGPVGLRFWVLMWVDPIADVLAPGYISNAEDLGMRAGDSFIYKDTNRGEWDQYSLIVLSVSAQGAAALAFPEIPEEAVALEVFADDDPDTYLLVYQGGRQVRVDIGTFNFDAANIRYVATRTALKAIDTNGTKAVYLTEIDRTGPFFWRAGNYTSAIAADTAEGVHVKADAVAASAGAWVRGYSGPVNAKWFGAKGDDSTDDQTALQAFFTYATNGYIPPGTYRFSGMLFPKSGQMISGAGTATKLKYTASSPPGSTPVIHMDGLSDVVLRDIQLEVSTATYPGSHVFNILDCSDCRLESITFNGGGGYPVYMTGSTRCSFIDFHSDTQKKNGFSADDCTYTTVDGWKLPDCSDGENGIQFINGASNRVTNCLVRETPDNKFGIYMFNEDDFLVSGNFVQDTRREALAVGGDSRGGKVLGNTLTWESNLGVGDFGMSVQGLDATHLACDMLIQGNTIVNSALDGIGLAGYCQRISISNNVIKDCARAAAFAFQAGIKLYCEPTVSVCDDNLISDNYISQVNGSGMTNAVTEASPAARNHIQGNHVFGISGDQYSLVAASGSRLVMNSNDVAGRVFEPVVAAGSGALTAYDATLTYAFNGKMAECTLRIEITTNGTGATNITCTLPFSASGGILTGKESSINGKGIGGGLISTTQLAITADDNTYPGGDGAVLVLMGLLELS